MKKVDFQEKALLIMVVVLERIEIWTLILCHMAMPLLMIFDPDMFFELKTYQNKRREKVNDIILNFKEEREILQTELEGSLEMVKPTGDLELISEVGKITEHR